jgi:hypothetical protein
MGATPNPFLQLAWNELSAAMPVALHDFPSLSAIALRDGVWKIEGEGARLEIELMGAEDEIRVTRTIPSGMISGRVYRVTCMRPNLPLLLDRAGNLAPPGIVLEELLEWLAEGSNPTTRDA